MAAIVGSLVTKRPVVCHCSGIGDDQSLRIGVGPLLLSISSRHVFWVRTLHSRPSSLNPARSSD